MPDWRRAAAAAYTAAGLAHELIYDTVWVCPLGHRGPAWRMTPPGMTPEPIDPTAPSACTFLHERSGWWCGVTTQPESTPRDYTDPRVVQALAEAWRLQDPDHRRYDSSSAWGRVAARASVWVARGEAGRYEAEAVDDPANPAEALARAVAMACAAQGKGGTV